MRLRDQIVNELEQRSAVHSKARRLELCGAVAAFALSVVVLFLTGQDGRILDALLAFGGCLITAMFIAVIYEKRALRRLGLARA